MAFGSVNVPGRAYKNLTVRLVSVEKTLGGSEKIPGSSPPTSQVAAQVGQIYINVVTGEQWKCISADENGTDWEKFTGSGKALSADDVGAKASGWVPFAAGTSAPADKTQLWIDTTDGTGGLKYWNGSAWVAVPVAYT